MAVNIIDETPTDFALLQLARKAELFRLSKRRFIAEDLSYLILVPTLRCNLSCSYCQVSRVAEQAKGFDWSRATLEAIFAFIDKQNLSAIKIEFQGGEPLLALDHLKAVRNFCRAKFVECEFVVCTNLQSVSPEAWDFLALPDVKISTSIDCTLALHEKQRMGSKASINEFVFNLDFAINTLGPDKISALPTIDPSCLPLPVELLDTYSRWSIYSIFLRPVANYGFARRKHDATSLPDSWFDFHRSVVTEMIRRNYTEGEQFEEFYFTHCLRRMIRADTNGHVDLRNPNILGQDYIVIDYDGSLYPTDEARMLTRTGQIDLSVGDVFRGKDTDKLATLNSNSSMDSDPDCKVCEFQPYCGRDTIDDLSRYGTISMRRTETAFCRKHMYLFSLAQELLVSEDPAVQHSIALWFGIPAWDPLLAKPVL